MTALKFSRKQLGIPYALFLAVFVIFPLLLIIFYAFTDGNGVFTFANFISFFKSRRALSRHFSLTSERITLSHLFCARAACAA